MLNNAKTKEESFEAFLSEHDAIGMSPIEFRKIYDEWVRNARLEHDIVYYDDGRKLSTYLNSKGYESRLTTRLNDIQSGTEAFKRIANKEIYRIRVYKFVGGSENEEK